MQAKEFWETRYIRIPYGRVTARVVCLMEGLQLHKQPGQARPSRDAGPSNPMGSVGFLSPLTFWQIHPIRMSHWRHKMVDGDEFWISWQWLAFLSILSRWQLIQKSAPSTIVWRQCDIRIPIRCMTDYTIKIGLSPLDLRMFRRTWAVCRII